MTTKPLGMLLMGIVFASASFAGDPAKDPLKELIGNWKAVKFHTGGKDLPAAVIDQLSVEIAGKTMTIRVKDKVLAAATLENIDPAKSPKQIDLRPTVGPSKGKLDLNCYSLEKDTLKFWSYSTNKSEKERPTKVPDGTENDIELIVLQRTK